MCCGRLAGPVAVSELIFTVLGKDGFHALNVFRGVYPAGGFAPTVIDFYHLDSQPVVEETHLFQTFYAAHFVVRFRQLKVIFERAEGVGVQADVAAYGAFFEGGAGFFGFTDGGDGAFGEGHGVAVFVYQHGSAAVWGGFFAFHKAVVLGPVQMDAGGKDIAGGGFPLVDELLDDPRRAKRVVPLQVDDESGWGVLLANGIPAALCAAAAGFCRHDGGDGGSGAKIKDSGVIRCDNVRAVVVVAANGICNFCYAAYHFFAGNFDKRLAGQTRGGVASRYHNKDGLRHGVQNGMVLQPHSNLLWRLCQEKFTAAVLKAFILLDNSLLRH